MFSRKKAKYTENILLPKLDQSKDAVIIYLRALNSTKSSSDEIMNKFDTDIEKLDEDLFKGNIKPEDIDKSKARLEDLKKRRLLYSPNPKLMIYFTNKSKAALAEYMEYDVTVSMYQSEILNIFKVVSGKNRMSNMFNEECGGIINLRFYKIDKNKIKEFNDRINNIRLQHYKDVIQSIEPFEKDLVAIDSQLDDNWKRFKLAYQELVIQKNHQS